MTNNFFLALVADAPAMDIPSLVMQAGWVVKGVMLLLIASSVISWTIIVWKWMNLRTVSAANTGFADAFWAAGNLEGAEKASRHFKDAPLRRIYDSGLTEFNHIKALESPREQAYSLLETNVQRSLKKQSTAEVEGLQSYLGFLATTASVAPFVGLLGTVWGIMTSFINIGMSGASNLAVVAPGIAEALIATAMGLFAAIPAVLFYNYFVHRIRMTSAIMNHFSSDFMNVLKRSL